MADPGPQPDPIAAPLAGGLISTAKSAAFGRITHVVNSLSISYIMINNVLIQYHQKYLSLFRRVYYNYCHSCHLKRRKRASLTMQP